MEDQRVTDPGSPPGHPPLHRHPFFLTHHFPHDPTEYGGGHRLRTLHSLHPCSSTSSSNCPDLHSFSRTGVCGTFNLILPPDRHPRQGACQLCLRPPSPAAGHGPSQNSCRPLVRRLGGSCPRRLSSANLLARPKNTRSVPFISRSEPLDQLILKNTILCQPRAQNLKSGSSGVREPQQDLGNSLPLLSRYPSPLLLKFWVCNPTLPVSKNYLSSLPLQHSLPPSSCYSLNGLT